MASNRRQFLAGGVTLGLGLNWPGTTGRPALAQAARRQAIRGIETADDGTEIMADLDRDLRIRNLTGTDGLGLCVWASLCMAARYHNCEPLFTLFDEMRKEPGGGWPNRVDEKMAQYAPRVKYEQYLGNKLDFIREHIARGRMVCGTYGYGELYEMQTIAHMIAVVCCTDRWVGVLDNNDPKHIWWMSPEEYLRRFNHPNGQGWAVAVHLPPPPPPPHNRRINA